MSSRLLEEIMKIGSATLRAEIEATNASADLLMARAEELEVEPQRKMLALLLATCRVAKSYTLKLNLEHVFAAAEVARELTREKQ